MKTSENIDCSEAASGAGYKGLIAIWLGLSLIFTSEQCLHAVLPIPPMQSSPWKIASTNLPAGFESAVGKIFEAGMADPRGCDYREIEIVVGDFRSASAKTIKTHGWILPAASGMETNFAIGWNGLIYRAVAIGSPADWKVDAAKMIRAMQPPAIPEKFVFQVGTRARADEESSLTLNWLNPAKAALIFRLGNPELVDDCAQLFPNKDPFLVLSSGYLWTAFTRVAAAHMRGDDGLAYDTATAVENARIFCGAEAKARGFELQSAIPGIGLNGRRESVKSEFYYPFLKTFPPFLNDQKRRHARQTPLRNPAAITNKADRIAALIDQLENVAAVRANQYRADVDLPGDPIVKALIAEGWDAVEPLLQCCEQDTRLTRIVPTSFFDWPPPLSPIEVRSAAYAAVECIIQTPQFAPQFSPTNTPADTEQIYRASAAKIREYGKKYFGTTDLDRFFAILQDDRGQWLEAATAIVQPTNRPVMPMIEWRYPWALPLNLEDTTPMRGESLRVRNNPSVTELMVKRIADTLERGNDYGDDASSVNYACNLLFCLAKWDPPSALETSQKLSALSASILSPTNYRSYCSHLDLAGQFAVMTEFRARLGDTNGLHEYALWLRSITPEHFSLQIGTMLHPLAQYPEAAGWGDIPELVFNDRGSVWCNYLFKEQLPDPKRMNSPSLNVEVFFDSPLINNAHFREFIIRLLHEKSPAGKIVGGPAHGYWLNQKLSTNRRYGYTVDAPKDGADINGKAFRTCDLYAWLLSKRIDGAPAFELYWPEEQRDQSISAIIALLKQKRSHLQTHHFQPA